MRILVIGKNGQIGYELCRTLAPLGVVIPVDVPEINLQDPDSIRESIADDIANTTSGSGSADSPRKTTGADVSNSVSSPPVLVTFPKSSNSLTSASRDPSGWILII